MPDLKRLDMIEFRNFHHEAGQTSQCYHGQIKTGAFLRIIRSN